MKASSFLNWKTALAVASVPFVAAWLQGTSSNASGGDMVSADAPSQTMAAADATTGADVSTSSSTDSNNTTATDAAQSLPTPAPPGMKLYGGTQEVVKLAQAGVGDDVILAYVTNANVRFGVNSDQIIYLNDLGVSGTVVTAMMQHDAAANAASAATPPPTMANVPAPGLDYANPPVPTMEDNGMANPPPDNSDYTDSGAPYPGDGTAADDTDYFYNPLQPYGSWIYVQGYGMCWQPTVCLRDRAWRPYCDRGRWLYSDCGWYWQSDYSWGWAAFHYGRWFCDDRRGWMWRPNRVWGPSWVAWRQSSEHCGWAPLPPSAVFVPGAGFRFHNQVVGASFDFGLPSGLFLFIPIERFGDYAPSRYVAAPWQAGRIYGESRMLNSVASQNQRVANLGMDPRLVDERAGVRMRRAVIQEIPGTDANGRVQPDRLGRHEGSLVIYRPQLPSASVQHGSGPSTGGAGVGMPRQNNFTPAAGGARTSLNASPAVPARTPMVLEATGGYATQPATGADAASHVHVYYVTHQEPKPAAAVTWSGGETQPGSANHATAAGTYPPNSMVLEGRRNVTNPQWNSTPSQMPSGAQNNNYRPSSSSSYMVRPGGGSTAGYQQYGNPYYRTPVVAVATPNPGTTYVPPGYDYRQSGYGAVPESSYRPEPQPRENYAPRESYSAPQPRENYSAPAPRESYSPPAQSSSHSSSSSQQSSSSSSSSSSSGSSRGR